MEPVIDETPANVDTKPDDTNILRTRWSAALDPKSAYVPSGEIERPSGEEKRALVPNPSFVPAIDCPAIVVD
jgi:hypothetical protein